MYDSANCFPAVAMLCTIVHVMTKIQDVAAAGNSNDRKVELCFSTWRLQDFYLVSSVRIFTHANMRGGCEETCKHRMMYVFYAISCRCTMLQPYVLQQNIVDHSHVYSLGGPSTN